MCFSYLFSHSTTTIWRCPHAKSICSCICTSNSISDHLRFITCVKQRPRSLSVWTSSRTYIRKSFNEKKNLNKKKKRKRTPVAVLAVAMQPQESQLISGTFTQVGVSVMLQTYSVSRFGFKSLMLKERPHLGGKLFLCYNTEKKWGVVIHNWGEHSFIGRRQAAQGKSLLRHPAFKTWTHVGTSKSLSLMFWLFICFSLYPAKTNFSCRTKVHPQNSPSSLLCRSRTFYLGKITAAQCSRYFSLMFFPTFAENTPRLCTLLSLNEGSSHCDGHRPIKFAVDSVIVPTNLAHPEKSLPKALFGWVCWSGTGILRSLPCWWNQPAFRPARYECVLMVMTSHHLPWQRVWDSSSRSKV